MSNGMGTTARWGLRLAAVTMAAAATLLAGAGPASAHVSADPPTVPAGVPNTVIVFRVPNERADAATTAVRIKFPTDHPIVSATTRSMPGGWTPKITRRDLDKPVTVEGSSVSQAVDTIEFSGGKIPVGQYEDFAVNVGPMPADPTTLVFPAIQVYESGEQVTWLDKPGPDGKVGDHPAPTVRVIAVTNPSGGGFTAAATPATTAPAAADTGSGNGGTLTFLALSFGSLGFILGATALALVLTRTRSDGPPGADDHVVRIDAGRSATSD